MILGILSSAAVFIGVCAYLLLRGNDRLYTEWADGRRDVHDITLYVSNSCVSCAELARCISRIYPLALIRIVYTGGSDAEEAALNKLSEINGNIS